MKKKWNALDVILLLLLLAVLAAGGYKLLSNAKNRSVQTDNQEIVYTASFNDVRGFTADVIHVGDRLYDNTTGAYMGTITAVEAEPFRTAESDSQGQVILAEKSGYYSVHVTVACPGLEKDDGYFLSDLVELKAGGIVLTYSKYFRSDCQFESIVSIGGVPFK